MINATALVIDTNFTANIVGNASYIPGFGATGAGIHARGGLVVRGGHFVDNRATTFSSGGAIRITTATVQGVTVPDYDNQQRVITGAVFRDNTAISGGAIEVDLACADIVDCEFRENVADIYGGALSLASSLPYDCVSTIRHSRFLNNSADFGGALSALSVNRVIVSAVSDVRWPVSYLIRWRQCCGSH